MAPPLGIFGGILSEAGAELDAWKTQVVARGKGGVKSFGEKTDCKSREQKRGFQRHWRLSKGGRVYRIEAWGVTK